MGAPFQINNIFLKIYGLGIEWKSYIKKFISLKSIIEIVEKLPEKPIKKFWKFQKSRNTKKKTEWVLQISYEVNKFFYQARSTLSIKKSKKIWKTTEKKNVSYFFLSQGI